MFYARFSFCEARSQMKITSKGASGKGSFSNQEQHKVHEGRKDEGWHEGFRFIFFPIHDALWG
jgi:hypothetical protein